MPRFFNTAGPVRAERNYCVPPLERFDLEEVLGLIRSDRYFVPLLGGNDGVHSEAERDSRYAPP